MNSERSPLYPAFGAAAPAALALWIALYLVWALVVDGILRAAGVVPYLLMGAVLFAAPIVIALLLFVAWPLAALLRRTVGLGRTRVLLAGAILAMVAREAVHHLWAEPEVGFLPLPVALLTGIGSAWVWWRVWSREGVWQPNGGTT